MDPENGNVRIVCEMSDFDRNPFLCLAEWLNLLGMVSIVRSVAGDAWSPSEMTFVSRQVPAETALAAFGNTRFLVGQPYCSIVVDANVLATSAPRDDTKAALDMLADAEISEGWTLVDALRSVIRPYLGEGYPDLARSAEIVGMSKRTLQRRLELAGCSYSKVVQQARFELARELLCDPSIKVIDIAFETGYQNPQHFARSFRQLSGVSPSSYRRHASN
jgi:AraC-like DNA-binding protein